MANERWFPKTESIPTEPGVYRWFDSTGRILYVGKAKNLRARLTSYFGNPNKLHERTKRMVSTAVRIDWTIVKTEFEALQLEFTWIKEFNPPFNVQFKDDKSYPYLAISFDEDFPRVFLTRSRNNRNSRYFGPYTQAWSVRETIDTLLRVFPMRSCSKSIFDTAERTGRPCLLADVGKCSAPCVSKVTKSEHLQIAKGFASFISGSDNSLVKEFQSKMFEASENTYFELAAKFRDQISALEAVRAKSAVVFEDATDADVIAIEMDGYSAAVNLFKVRDGRIRGANGWVVDLELERTLEELLSYTIENIYLLDEFNDVPKEIIVQVAFDDLVNLEILLGARRGSKVSIRTPKRGDKASLLDTALANAKHSLSNYKLKRSTDFTTRSEALGNLQETLGLSRIPLIIECFDVSHLSGTDVVASKVVFEDGRPKKDLYRRYNIPNAKDDTDAMNQVLERRFRLQTGNDSLPQLVVVDGAGPQVRAALRAIESQGIKGVTVVGIAKRLEELWTADDNFPVILPRASAELFLIQHLRDEAHRFAITHQRNKRTAQLSSVLEEIPGLGQSKVKLLLKHFGSVKRVRQATVAELTDLPGIGPVLAEQIIRVLNE